MSYSSYADKIQQGEVNGVKIRENLLNMIQQFGIISDIDSDTNDNNVKEMKEFLSDVESNLGQIINRKDIKIDEKKKMANEYLNGVKVQFLVFAIRQWINFRMKSKGICM